MELNEKIDGVKGREDLIRFIFDLRMDLQNNRERWKNITLENYLEAVEAWVKRYGWLLFEYKSIFAETTSLENNCRNSICFKFI